jgi:hypothetical protein
MPPAHLHLALDIQRNARAQLRLPPPPQLRCHLAPVGLLLQLYLSVPLELGHLSGPLPPTLPLLLQGRGRGKTGQRSNKSSGWGSSMGMYEENDGGERAPRQGHASLARPASAPCPLATPPTCSHCCSSAVTSFSSSFLWACSASLWQGRDARIYGGNSGRGRVLRQRSAEPAGPGGATAGCCVYAVSSRIWVVAG